MNATDELPVKQKGTHPTQHHCGCIIKRPDGKLLIAKRKKDQLLGGLWNFCGKVEPKESLETASIREIKEEVNLDISVNGFLCKVNHAYRILKSPCMPMSVRFKMRVQLSVILPMPMSDKH